MQAPWGVLLIYLQKDFKTAKSLLLLLQKENPPPNNEAKKNRCCPASLSKMPGLQRRFVKAFRTSWPGLPEVRAVYLRSRGADFRSKQVAFASDRYEKLSRPPFFPKFAAQMSDMHVDRPRADFRGSNSPNRAEDLCPRQDLPPVLPEITEQAGLSTRQRAVLSVRVGDLSRCEVDQATRK